MDTKVVTTELEGRLGNAVFILLKLFNSCKLAGIGFDNVVIDGGRAPGSDGIFSKTFDTGFFYKRMDFFYGIRDNILPRRWFSTVFDESQAEKVATWTQLRDAFVSNGKSAIMNTNMVYFAPDKRDVFLELFMNMELFNKNKDELESDGVRTENAVALHVRRTDFAMYHNGEYLESAYSLRNKIRSVSPENTILVFSDDIEWCRTALYDRTRNIRFVKPGRDVDDVMKMGACSCIVPSRMSAFSRLGMAIRECTKQ